MLFFSLSQDCFAKSLLATFLAGELSVIKIGRQLLKSVYHVFAEKPIIIEEAIRNCSLYHTTAIGLEIQNTCIEEAIRNCSLYHTTGMALEIQNTWAYLLMFRVERNTAMQRHL